MAMIFACHFLIYASIQSNLQYCDRMAQPGKSLIPLPLDYFSLQYKILFPLRKKYFSALNPIHAAKQSFLFSIGGGGGSEHTCLA